jgi:hypothetical protein
VTDPEDRDYRRPRGRVGKRVFTVIVVVMFVIAAFERLVLSGGSPF